MCQPDADVPGAVIAALMGGCWRTPIEYVQPACCSRAISFRFQNPESARRSFGPVAPARATRGINSSTNRSAPREVFAEPLRARMCSTSPVPARVARIGWYPRRRVYP